jgi:hypothetical protein
MSKAIFLFSVIVYLLSSCQENDVLVVELKSIVLNTFEINTDGLISVNTPDSLTKEKLIFSTYFDFTSNMMDVGYDPVETETRLLNSIDSFSIWSSESIFGLPPNTPLNSHFIQYVNENKSYELEYGLIFNLNFNEFDEPIKKTNLLICESVPTTGIYSFYFKYHLSNGITKIDSIKNIKLY